MISTSKKRFTEIADTLMLRGYEHVPFSVIDDTGKVLCKYHYNGSYTIYECDSSVIELPLECPHCARSTV